MSTQPSNVETVGNIKTPASMDYKVFSSNASRYLYLQRFQQNGGNTQVLTPNGTPSSVFEIPPNVYNFSKSYLQFVATFAATGTANGATKVLLDTPPIARMRLRDDQGVLLVDENEFQAYWHMSRCAYPKAKYMQHGPVLGGATEAAALATKTICKFHNPANVGSGVAMAALSVTGQRITNGGALTGATPAAILGESKQQVITSAAVTIISIACEIDFSQLVFKFLSCPKNIYTPRTLFLEIDWAPVTSFAFIDVDGAGVTAINAAAAAANMNCTLSRLAVSLAVEQNPINVRELQQQTNSGAGLKMLYPFSQVLRNVIAAAGVAASQFRIGPNIGNNLLRCISSENLANGATNTNQNYTNFTGAKYTRFRHQINGVNYELQDLVVENNEDYLFNESKLVDSALHGLLEYYNTPSHILEFSSVNKLIECNVSDFSEISGLPTFPLQININKDITTAAANINQLLLAVGQKQIISTATGFKEISAAVAQPSMLAAPNVSPI